MLQPLGFRVLIKPEGVEDKTEAGIVLLHNEKLEKANVNRGVIVAVGPDAWKAFRKVSDNGKEVNGQAWAQPGDQVYYSRFAGRILDDPTTGEEFVIVNDDDVLMVIKEGDNPDMKPAKYKTPKEGKMNA